MGVLRGINFVGANQVDLRSKKNSAETKNKSAKTKKIRPRPTKSAKAKKISPMTHTKNIGREQKQKSAKTKKKSVDTKNNSGKTKKKIGVTDKNLAEMKGKKYKESIKLKSVRL